MKKLLKQFRYYGEARNDLNYPPTITKTNLYTGGIFFTSNDLLSIQALGIQAVPGTKFYLNNSVESIIVGSTGIYELDLADGYEITALKFDSASLNLINDPTNSAYLIIDAIYNVEG